MSSGTPESAASREEADSVLEELLGKYVDDLNRGIDVDPEEVIAAHPRYAADILRELETFEGIQRAAPLGNLGDYTLRRPIGRGGMGVVYEAWENSMERRVALKVLPAGIAADARGSARFLREAQTAGKLSHPNVVPVYFTGVKEQTPFYAMEYVEGETLAQVLARNRAEGATPPQKGEAPAQPTFGATPDKIAFYANVAEAFADVADGLQHAHSNGVVHRDIKPSNLILDADGRLRILDFGLARLEGQDGLTLSGDFVGTPAYMSPEQAKRTKVSIDHRTDVYSLGATLYELLTQERPFRGKDHADTLSQIIEREPRPPQQLNPRVPEDLETIVLKCLRKDAGDRYGTAEALGQDLGRFVRGDAIEARPEASWDVWRRRVWSARQRLAVIGMTLLLLALAGWIAVTMHRDQQAAKEREYVKTVRGALGAIGMAQFSGKLGPGQVLEQRTFASYYLLGSGIDGGPGRQNELLASLEKLERATELIPDRPDAPYHRARLMRLLGEEDAALETLDALLLRDPGFAPAHGLRAAIHQDRGETERAEESIAVAKRHARPDRVESWFHAQQATGRGHWVKAEAAYTELMRLEPRVSTYLGAPLELLLGRGIARLEQRKYWEATRDLTAAVTLRPEALAPALLIGQIQILRDAPDRAHRWFEEFFGNARLTDRAAFEIAHLFFLQGFPQALVWARRIKADLLRSRMVVFTLVDRVERDDATREGERALQKYPDDPFILAFLSNLWSLPLGDRDRAEQFAERALRSGTGLAPIHFILGLGHWSRGDLEAAEADFVRALEHDSTMTLVCDYLAWLYSFMRRDDDALRLASECAARESRREWPHFVRGQVYRRQKLLAQAKEELDTALSLSPENNFVLIESGHLQVDQGDPIGAERSFRRAIEAFPNEPDAKEALARLLQRRGALDEALSLYCEALPRSRIPVGRMARRIARILRTRPSPGMREPLGELERFLAPYVEAGRAPRRVRELYSLLLARTGHVEAALQYAQQAFDATSGKNPDTAATLAVVQRACGNFADAVATLEKAIMLPNATRELHEKLDLFRLEASLDG